VDPLGDVTGTNLQPLDEGSYTQPEFGAVELSPDGGLTYTPQEGWSGATSFTVDVCDDQDQCALLVYDVLVRPSDDPVGDATGTAGELAETGPIAWRWPTALAALMTAVGAGLVAASRVAGTHRRRAN
jgi:hypothetical protein